VVQRSAVVRCADFLFLGSDYLNIMTIQLSTVSEHRPWKILENGVIGEYEAIMGA